MRAAIVLLAGCANGVQMTEEDVRSCRDEGCAAFTEVELRGLIRKAMSEGCRRGWTDAHQQAGRGA